MRQPLGGTKCATIIVVRATRFEWKPTEWRKPHESWSEDVLAGLCVAVYCESVDPQYQAHARPDRVERHSPAVDLFLTSPAGKPIAIEITRIETFARQNETQSLARAFLSPLEEEIRQWGLRGITCELPPYPFIRGDDWRKTAAKLRLYIIANAESIPEGSSVHIVPDVPFPVMLLSDPYSPFQFMFRRADPPPDVIAANLRSNFEKALKHKRHELARLRRRGYRTALLLFTEDINFYRMNWDAAYKAFLRAESTVGADHVDDVLFAFAGDSVTICCMAFAGDREFRVELNTEQMKFGPEYRLEWPLFSASA